MTLENNRAPLLYCYKLCASFHSHRWIQSKVTVRKRSVRLKIGDFFVLCNLEIWRMTLKKANLRDLIAATGLVILLKLDSNRRFFARVTLKFDGWHLKIIRHVFYTISSFVYHFISISEFKLELQSRNTQSGSNSTIILAVWPWNLTEDLENNRAPLLFYFKLCASFRSHWWIQTWVRVRKCPIWVKFDDF